MGKISKVSRVSLDIVCTYQMNKWKIASIYLYDKFNSKIYLFGITNKKSIKDISHSTIK